jgi:hypothetical protein
VWHNSVYFHTQYYSGAIIMSEETQVDTAATPEAVAAPEATAGAEQAEELSYHAVQKDGKITAIWEMRGRKHIRTIDPRSEEGRHLLGPHDHAEANPEA